MMTKKATVKEPEPIWARPTLKGMSMEQIVHRVGALEVLSMPSRMGATLVYPNGNIVKDKSKS